MVDGLKAQMLEAMKSQGIYLLSLVREGDEERLAKHLVREGVAVWLRNKNPYAIGPSSS
jgi:hypothetical protein